MPRTLLILRHAKSAWDTDAASDFDRPLAKRGKNDAPRMGRWLHAQSLVADVVICSPAKRARQTALRVCEETGVAQESIHWDKRIYDAAPGTLLRVLAEAPSESAIVMIVGHNPGLEQLVRYLCGRRIPMPDDGKLLPTATVACLEMPADWSDLQTGEARMVSITRPRDLDDV
jgi:phosphohistidine phosphatase